jgi:hypothetical protein
VKNREEDWTIVETPAGVTPKLTERGWFLVRFMKPLLVESFENFTSELHAGDLPDEVVSSIARAISLPRL